MRIRLLTILLLIATNCHAGPAAKRFLLVGNVVKYEAAAFEGATISPWASATFGIATDQFHAGSKSAKVTAPSGAAVTMTRTMDTAGGTFGMWIRYYYGANHTVLVTVGATTVINQVLSGAGSTWYYVSGPCPAGAGQLVTISVTPFGAGETMWIDDIAIPIP